MTQRAVLALEAPTVFSCVLTEDKPMCQEVDLKKSSAPERVI